MIYIYIYRHYIRMHKRIEQFIFVCVDVCMSADIYKYKYMCAYQYKANFTFTAKYLVLLTFFPFQTLFLPISRTLFQFLYIPLFIKIQMSYAAIIFVFVLAVLLFHSVVFYIVWNLEQFRDYWKIIPIINYLPYNVQLK